MRDTVRLVKLRKCFLERGNRSNVDFREDSIESTFNFLILTRDMSDLLRFKLVGQDQVGIS